MGQSQSDSSRVMLDLGKEGYLLRKLDCTKNPNDWIPITRGVLSNIGDNRSLVSVRLDRMGVGENVRPLTAFVFNNECLRYLSLNRNGLSGGTIVDLLNAANRLKCLRYFSAENQIGPLTDEEEEEIVRAVERSVTLYRVGVSITNENRRLRLERTLSQNRRRWVICDNRWCKRVWICPFELPDLCECYYVSQWRFPLQWLRAHFPRQQNRSRDVALVTLDKPDG